MLALDLYFREGPNAPRTSTDELSHILRAFPIEAELAADPGFRSEASVRTKLANFRALDPRATGGLTHGSALDAAIWGEFQHDRNGLASLASVIRAAVQSGETAEVEQPDVDFVEAEEGAILTRLHRVRERSRKLVQRKKQRALRQHGELACEACGFVYATRYGPLGANFIECHHRQPVSDLLPGSKTTLEDLALVCANCHRMIHCRRPWLTVEELRVLVQAL
ncbi:MAG TPA: HNH endonuclease [Gaiellaceae bacterium]|nr:HNH endonuclease [Gaiellaceae bacterium]